MHYTTSVLGPFYRYSHDTPIYIGKATPSGGRKNAIETDVVNSKALLKRLSEHKESIEYAKNLRIEDFVFRTLMVSPLWIYHGESFLIGHHNPLWNVVLDGFGNANPGSNRTQQPKSKWDVMHPGRPYSNANCEIEKHSVEKLQQDIEKYYSNWSK